jgi:hypothetical protein
MSFTSASDGENALAALAEAASPYGIETLDETLNLQWAGARR